jgi:histidine triad (HIT) family protein
MLEKSCIFCRMINGEIPTQVVYNDGHVFAFRDINPQAPTHILLVPKAHFASINEIDGENIDYVGKIFSAAKIIAKQEGVAETGYRLVTNTGPSAGQSVFHLHVHLLAGRTMSWPPG